MPAGSDPADLLASGGADSFSKLLDGSIAMIQFQVRRLLADADLDTPAGRDRALEEARGLIAATPERTAMRDELVREIADRLDVPPEYVRVAPRPRATLAAPAALPAGSSAGEVAFRAEREFLTFSLASGDVGRRYLSLPSDDQFSSEITRRAREHLVARFDDPLAGLPEDEPALGAFVSDVVHAAHELPAKPDSVLRMSILQLEGRRIEREIRRATQDGDHARHTELAAAEQRVRAELGEVMGQTA
jgi:DNA primase